MKTRKTVVLAKLEESYGVDPTPTEAANALKVWDVDIKPSAETIDNPYFRDTLTPAAIRKGNKFYEVSFKSDLKGSGTRGARPTVGWEGDLLQACGMSETVTPDVSIVYSPVSDDADFKSITLYVYRDGHFHKVLGCRGTWKLIAEAGKQLVVEWKFNGIFSSVTDDTAAACTYSAVVPELVVSGALTMDGDAHVASKVELDINNTLSMKKSINAPTGIGGYEITGRAPNGNFDPEAVAEATHPFWGNWEDAVTMALNLGPLGETSGNIIQIACPSCQYGDLAYADRDGTLIMNAPFTLTGDGDDELTIIMT